MAKGGPHLLRVRYKSLATHPPSSPTYRRAGLGIPLEEKENYGFFRPSQRVIEAWERTKAVSQALEVKVIVFQCPPSFIDSGENLENMKEFFQAIERGDSLFAWEPRGGWSAGTIEALCRELGLIHCVDPFEEEPLSGPLKYFRLHGGPGYRHTYSTQELQWLADKWSVEKDAYFLFNNLTMGEDALRFKLLLEERMTSDPR
jgi:uncharacterized protein YecE (DUF72 family)